MQKANLNEELFDLLLKAAAKKAFTEEANEIPPSEYLNEHYKPSASLDKRIRKIISSHTRKKRGSSWKTITSKAAAILAVFITISGTLLLSVEASRNIILSAFFEWRNEYFSVQYEDALKQGLIIYRPTYLPEGFSEVSVSSSNGLTRIIYKNEFGTDISLTQLPAQSSNVLADNEDKNVTDVFINNCIGFLIETNEHGKENTLFWEQEGFLFNIASAIESNELILIAESITP